MRDRRRADRSSPRDGRLPHVPTPRPRPRSVGALLLAAVAGIGITVASSVFGRCDGAADAESPASSPPPATGAR